MPSKPLLASIRTRTPVSDPPYIEAIEDGVAIAEGSYREVNETLKQGGYAIESDSVTPRDRIWSDTGRDPGELNNR